MITRYLLVANSSIMLIDYSMGGFVATDSISQASSRTHHQVFGTLYRGTALSVLIHEVAGSAI
jgi:hypothetical protein